MSGFHPSLVDPTDKPADGLIIKSVGGRTGPLNLENGATLSFPWAPQQRLTGSKPGVVYAEDDSDSLYGAHETLVLLGPHLDSGSALADRASIKLIGWYQAASGVNGVVELRGGEANGADFQPRLTVGLPDPTAAPTITIETYPDGGHSGGVEGFLRLGGNIIHHSEDKTTPPASLAHDAKIPLLVRGRTYSSGVYSNNGNATGIGHQWIQGLSYGGSAWTPATLTINPYGGDVELGKAGVTTPVKVVETGTANNVPALGTGAVHPFRIGSATVAAANFQLAFTGRGIQALENGVGAALYLNAGGGAVFIGATDVAGAWTAYTPTLVQNVAVSKTVTYAKYTKIGRTVTVMCSLACTSAGTVANSIFVGLPFAPAANSLVTGTMYVYDASANTNYVGTCITNGTAVNGASHASAGAFGVSGFAAALANGDTIWISLTYEAST